MQSEDSGSVFCCQQAWLGCFVSGVAMRVTVSFEKKPSVSSESDGFLASILGALPYYFILPHCNPADAFFESVSGFTTTGATVFSNYEELLPPSLLFWRSLSQWIGGLGVVVLFVAIVSNLGAGAKVLFSNESSGQSADIDDGTIKQGAKRIMFYYMTISAACFIAYMLAGLSWFDAICHMATTVSTGGFSTINAGVPGFENPLLEWLMILFMFLGGFSFLLAIKFIRTGWRARNPRARRLYLYCSFRCCFPFSRRHQFFYDRRAQFPRALSRCFFSSHHHHDHNGLRHRRFCDMEYPC